MVILGLPDSSLLILHVALSLLGIAAGLIAVLNLAEGRYRHRWVVAFLVLTFFTSASGFPLPPFGLDPPRIVGLITLATVVLACVSLMVFKLAGAWRVGFIIGSVTSLYFNIFVAIAQSFQKIDLLQSIAPAQDSAVFIATQLICLGVFIWLGVSTYRRLSRLSLPFA